MKNHAFVFLALLSTVVGGSFAFGNGFALPAPTRITCSHKAYPLTLIAELKSGDIRVYDNVNFQLVSFVQKAKVSYNNGVYRFKQTNREDLPTLVLVVRTDENGFGEGVSIDDKSGNKSHYKCVVN